MQLLMRQCMRLPPLSEFSEFTLHACLIHTSDAETHFCFCTMFTSVPPKHMFAVHVACAIPGMTTPNSYVLYFSYCLVVSC